MKKSLVMLWLCAVVMVVFPQTIFAHTGLQKATPAKGETISKELTQIDLVFNTVIESDFALKVADAQGAEIPVTVENGKRSLKGLFATPLASGTYKVNWQIAGEDGHKVEGEYSFTVALPVPDTTDQQEQTGTANTNNAAASTGNQTPAAAEGQVNDSESDQAGSSESNTNTADADSSVQQPAQSSESEGNRAAAESSEPIPTKTIVLTIVAILLVGGFGFGIYKAVKRK